MEKQESKNFIEVIKDKVEKIGQDLANLFWFFINFLVLISVIALLYEGGFFGASIILYKLAMFFFWFLLVWVIILLYIRLLNYLVKKNKPNQIKRRNKFKQEIKEEILKEINGRRKSSK